MSTQDTTEIGMSNDEWEKPASTDEGQPNSSSKMQSGNLSFHATQNLVIEPQTPSFKDSIAGPLTPDIEEPTIWSKSKHSLLFNSALSLDPECLSMLICNAFKHCVKIEMSHKSKLQI